MRKIFITALCALVSACLWAADVAIPTPAGTPIDWTNAVLSSCNLENGGANIGSTRNGSTAVFTLQNETAQSYLLTFLSGCKSLTAVVSFTITDGAEYTVTKQFDCSNTGAWTPSEVHNAIFEDVPTGTLTMTFKVESTTGSYAGNYGGLSLASMADFGKVPGGIDLTSGVYSNCQTESAGNVGFIRNDASATYNIQVTKAGAYNLSWDVTRYNGTTVDVEVYDFATGAVELSESLTIPEVTNYENDLQALGDLTLGAKRLTLTFHCESGYVCNYKNLALRYAGADINYYTFSYNVTGGPSTLVSMTAAPAAVSDGRYEEGTLITLTAADNTLFMFQHWADGSATNPRSYRLTESLTETATYEILNGYLAGWDFSKGYGSAADYAEREENESASLYLLNPDGTKAGKTYWNQGGSARIWVAGEYDYCARLNAQNYKDISLQSKLSFSYNVWPTTQLQYSLDGTNWTNVEGASLTFTADDRNKWLDFNATLPAACNHAETLYLRWASVRPMNGEEYDTGVLVGSESENRALQIKDIFVLGYNEVFNDTDAPTVILATPNEGAQHAKREGSITLLFDKNVQLTGSATLNGQALQGTVLGSRVTFDYSGLNSNTDYTFTLPAGSISNENNVANEEPITLNFKTVVRNTVAEKHAFDFVIGVDGTADEAFAAANASEAERFYIFVPDGSWELNGNATDPGKKTNVSKTVSIIGQTRDGAVLWNDDESEYGFGISSTSTLNLQGQYSYVQDLTIKNWRGQGDTQKGVAVALSEKGYNIYKNVHIWGNQDTYVTGGTNYWEGGRISGSVDYICGAGNLWFEGTELLNTRSGSVITAPRTGTAEQWGYVFNNCSVGSYYDAETATAGKNSVCENGGYTFGRPWGDAAKATYLGTLCSVLPADAGWQAMSTGVAFRFKEFGSMSKSGRRLDLSGRSLAGIDQTSPDCDTEPVLSQSEAAAYTLDAVMGNDFIPTRYTEQCDAPVVTLNGRQLTWTDDPYALCYIVFRGGVFVACVTTNSYTAAEDGLYTVCAANEMGGLSPLSNAVRVSTKTKAKVHGLGDSTATDHAETGTMRGWVQMLQQFFDPDKVQVVNHAKSGQSTKSFYDGIWDKGGRNKVEAGDFVLISFAHNDEQNGTIDGDTLQAYYLSLGTEEGDALAASISTRGTDPMGSYKYYLRKYIEEVKAAGAYPVMVSPICRSQWTDGKVRATARHNLYQNYDAIENGVLQKGLSMSVDNHTKDYVYQSLQVANEYEGIPFIDLTTATEELFNHYGQEFTGSRLLCGTDGTHLGLTGATLTARAFARLVKAQAQTEPDSKKRAVLQELALALIEQDLVMSFSPVSGDFGQCYVGQTAQRTYSASCFGLENATGEVKITATGGYEVSVDGGATWGSAVDTTFDANTLIQNMYIRVTPVAAGTVSGELTVTADGIVGALALTAEAFSIANGPEVLVLYPLDDDTATPTVQGDVAAAPELLVGIKYDRLHTMENWPEGSGIQSGESGRKYTTDSQWPVGEEDENPARYMQWSLTVNEDAFPIDIDEISLYMSGAHTWDMSAKVYYSKNDPTFSNEAVNIVWSKSISTTIPEFVQAKPVMRLVAGDVLYVRLYPYVPLNEAATRPSIVLRNVKIHGYSHTGNDPSSVESVTGDRSPLTVTKVLRNGQIFIICDGKEYNILGMETK
ncbi:MAG: pectinesterase family protein [Paludibacteraceae bacterium]